MKRLLERLRALRTRRDEGASAVEYGLLVALIAVVIAGTVLILGQTLKGQFDNVCNAVANGANNSCPKTGGGGGGGGGGN